MAEKQEFYNLINDKTKVPRLTPVPRLDYSTNERSEKNSIQKFRAQAMKFVKSRPPPSKSTDKWKTSIRRISRSFYTDELIKLARSINSKGLLPEWEENIFKLIPKTSKRKHILFLMSVMKEVKQEYLKEMQELSVRTLINIDVGTQELTYPEDHLQKRSHNGVIESSFQDNRKLILSKYFLSHPLVRCINRILFNNLPKNLINLDNLKNSKQISVPDMIKQMNSDVQKCSIIVQDQCYNEIVGRMLQMNYLKNDKRLPKLLHCAESFMVQQILNSMMNSISTLILTLKSPKNFAQLRVQMLFKNDTIELEPSMNEIFSSFNQLVDNISNIAQNLVPFEEWMGIKKKTEYIKVRIPEWFLNESHNNMNDVLQNNFKCLHEHYESVRNEFENVCSENSRNRIATLIARKNEYEVYCVEVEKYNEHLSRINTMVGNIYYDFGILNQTPAIDSMKQNTKEIVDLLINELVESHLDLNRSICIEFEQLESRALSIPDDTKALFELSDYVSYASKILIKTLGEKVEKSVKMLCSLIEIAILSNEHIELNKTTINWLELIKPVFSQHNIFCEAKKGELEDELQRKITILSAEIDEIFPELVIIDDMDDAKRVTEYKEFLAVILSKINQVDNHIGSINTEEKLFKFPETSFPKVDEIKEVMNSFCALIQIIHQWQKDHEVWMDGPFEYLNSRMIEEKTAYYVEKITEIHKNFKIKIKSDLTSNKPFKFSGIVDDPDPLQQPAPLKLCWQTLQEIHEFEKYVPLASCMCNPALEKRHWDEMSTIAGFELMPNAGTTLRKLTILDLLKNFELYEAISIGANQELVLKQKFHSLMSEWKTIDFSIANDSETEMSTFAEESKIEMLFEAHFIEITKMRASFFVPPIETELVSFYKKLCCIRDTVELWNVIQEKSKYLNMILINETVQDNLETEVTLYVSVKKVLKTIETDLQSTPTFNYVTRPSNILDKLKQGDYALKLIDSKVHEYFDQMRILFARFFFMSDIEIVELLFAYPFSSGVKAICKCFPNVSQLVFNENSNVQSIIGEEGEVLELNNAISTESRKGSIVDWLILLENEIVQTIKCRIGESVQSFDEDLSMQSISGNLAMVTYCVHQIMWTSQIHSCFLHSNIEALKICLDRVKTYKEKAQGYLKLNLNRKDRKIISSLIILLIHHEEVISMLIEKKVQEDTDFDWKAQIRQYYQNEQVKVIIINTCIDFAYEYYSSDQIILVNTPLTERCYRNLMEAYYQNYFVSITGFSGVGKTETIKNLTRILAMPFFTVPGQHLSNYDSVRNMFKGIVAVGAWIFIENYTQIREELLSVMSQYVFRISQSKQMDLNTINIDGTQFLFNPRCYMCFSMNPASMNPSPVPENLKSHFRIVAFMCPDIQKICQVELFASGFNDSKSLAVTLMEFYNLCNDQINSGSKKNLRLRNLKSVISTATKLKLAHPNEEEKVILMRAIVDLNLSQFCDYDVVAFQNIFNITFLDVNLPSPDYTSLLEILEKVSSDRCLSAHAIFKLKIIQLYEMFHLKQAIIILGDPMSGKSSLMSVFADILSIMQVSDNQADYSKITCEYINPESLDIARLYGSFEEKTNDWNYGILPKILRLFKENHQSKYKILIFDGNINSWWSETLGSVIDDDKTLFSDSNERITLDKTIKIIFESMNLEKVSPTLISRCGIVHIPSQISEWKSLLKANLTSIDQFCNYQEEIYALFEWTIDPCLKFLHENCTAHLVLSDMHLVMSTLRLFKMYMSHAVDENTTSNEKDPKDHMIIWSQAAIMMATIWSFAGCLESESRKRFEVFYASLWSKNNEDYPRPNSIKQIECSLPPSGKFWDNMYIFKGTGYWKSYDDILKLEKIVENSGLQESYIPTANTVQLSMLLDLHMKYRKPFILCGENSCGKTTFLHNYLKNLSDSEYVTNRLNFSAIVDAPVGQSVFLSRLNKIKRHHYESSKKRYCIFAIDDLSVNAQDVKTNCTMEMIRQFMDQDFWYEMVDLEKVKIANILFTASMTLGTKNSSICPRFLRHFNVFFMDSPSRNNIFRIFSNTLTIDLKRASSPADIISSINGIVNATVDIYLSIAEQLNPIPAKILYHFSLRDIQRIMKGCGLIAKESVETKITFIRLWAHEIFRVFGDRIIDDQDQECLFSTFREAMRTHLKDQFESVFDSLPKFGNDEITKDSFKSLLFGNFMDTENRGKKYEEITSIENLKNKCQQYVKDYRTHTQKNFDFVVTCHTLQHLIRICRILATPKESLIIVGPSGSGRRSLTRLAAYIQQQSLFEPVLKSGYDLKSWREDLKTVMMDCGTLKKETTFMMTDRQMKPEFMNDINILLRSGDIPSLFTDDEYRSIVRSVRIDAQKGSRNAEIDMSHVFDYFIEQCRFRLHFVLNISPLGKTLKDLLLNHPTLFEQCTINRFNEWPDEAIEQVAIQRLKEVDLQDTIKRHVVLASKYIFKEVRGICMERYQESTRQLQLSPAAFLRSTKIYNDILLTKQKELTSKKQRYLAGLDKLDLAAREVSLMKNTLTELRPQLESSARQTEATMKEIESENLSVEKATILVKRDEEIANKKAEIAGILRAECESELAVAIPILEDALAALNTLKPTDITLVKAMKNPPDTVKLVMAAVCVMLNISSERVVDPVTGRKSMDFWGPSKRVLGDMNFLQTLKDYDKDNIAPAIMTTIKKNYMSDKSFNPHIVAKASSAAEGLCKWVRAMVSYDEVAKVVAPKKEKLAAAQKECDETEAFLNAKRKTLADLNLKLSALKRTLEETLLRKVRLEREVDKCTVKLKKAEALIASLGGEKSKWMDSANKLATFYDNLAGDVVLSSAMIAYLGYFNLKLRDKFIIDWKEFMKSINLPFSEEYDFIEFLKDEAKINKWHLCGLSSNRFSLQNAIVTEYSPLWCLFVDPQVQANEWIKKSEKSNNLKVVNIATSNYTEVIRKNIELGNPVLLENIGETIGVALNPILERDVYQNSDICYLDFGKDTLVYNPNFRLYMTTRFVYPRLPPDVFDRVTVIDFLLPSDAIRDRLLDIVIFRERPELQEKFEKILIENINNKRILKQQEDTILYTLSKSNANILEDEAAIKILDSSKSLAVDLLRRQEATRITKEEIDAFRETYSQFTKYCADLYDTLNLLPNLNHMYRFSLSWFTQLYMKSIETSNRSVIHKRRIDYLKTSSIQNLHQSVNNALFERHKLIYSFILCVKTLMDTEQITMQEFSIFMNIGKKFSGNHENENICNPALPWLSDESWKEICRISVSLGIFQNFPNSFTTNNTKWRKYCASNENDESFMPAPWDYKLTLFQKLILIRILCPDRIVAKIIEFVESVMGPINSSTIPCNISRPYNESSCFTPLIFILPSYSSPFVIVNKYAKILGYAEKLHLLSMGPSQERKAELLIEIARKNGEWVFLQNCHLALSWMARLEDIIEGFDANTTALGFRLWLSSETSDKFPIGVLQNSIKIAFDSPYGIKQTLTWTYKTEPVKEKEFFEGCPGKDKAFTKLLYGFCLFHAVVRERKNFGLQSWNLLVISDSYYDFDTVHAYRVPKRIEYKDYLKHIKNSIPNQTTVEDIFLDKNISIVVTEDKVKSFLDSISYLNETIANNKTEAAYNFVLSRIEEILDLLPANFNVSMVQQKYPISETESLNWVLNEEIEALNRVLSAIRTSLLEIRKALQGHQILSEDLEKITKDIFEKRTPELWKLYVSLQTKVKLQDFVADLLERYKFLDKWINDGHPRFYWFGGLMHCKRLLSIMRIKFAVEKKVPIDQIEFQFNVLDIKNPIDDYEIAENTLCIYGLYLVGAKWNEQTKSLSASKPRVLYNCMPVVSIEISHKKSVNYGIVYKCPLYISPVLHNIECHSEDLSENYILSINLKCDNPKSWIKRGTALYCQSE
ncbi:hypothetical protein QAD02_004685 [Eretmocerus hayati]|uniref:Uncharacterized protein n=1 Tax=Eretmocerus hayati TaxID=131215 RepID=A0ACC2NRE0_9HYME|nr:hypothetical protein QAD02_004685 [Eretmocerus hayati]